VVVLMVAAQDKRVRRLVLGGVGAGVVEVGGVDTRVIPCDALRQALETDDPRTIGHAGAAAFRAFADALEADRRALAAHTAAVHAVPIALADVMAPTLILAGHVDPLAVRPEVLANAIPGASVQLLSGDHFGAMTDPDCAQAIVDFLGRAVSIVS
jgi:pimeloyl-ACP methyl ester carboxylesterase